ncbi:hypothetical protein GUITHDRAFT_156950 [Guillardia theta CCMP2712]|uniref:Transmembrane 9 superfamily member n=1 Tax=Guillardia theta (strain CCMP2712) TaxID=905079 RepID=L1JZQ2_GUITC|nr:hypothetical protein GUITHDRAFT_156950 [Guillardia theta CCMP2712]EKX53685.1 hypothetical protein GUITHDRAFT_156950 [Guillardia theta CCMP2712]|eukprot:XP_005840665.1 hypothetical protein GUITHDRAFT_156950 [Guillardia theta CCMP2712]
MPGEKLNAKVEALTSTRTQLPYEYYVLPFCRNALNLGEVLRGSRIYNTPYSFNMGVNQNCKILCHKEYTQEEVQEFALMIEEEYRAHFLLDNLPVAMTVFHENGPELTYETGYPIATKHSSESRKNSKPQIALFNHLRFTILYHEDPKKHAQRIVGFEVEPLSVKHTYLNKVDFEECLGRQSGENGLCNLNTCSAKKQRRTEVLWTYDVIFQPSKIKWSTRWDTYLQSADDAQVHWFSILNSFMIVLFLSGLIAMIMIRTLRKDFDRYQRKDVIEEGQEETGWKLVHGDVFRPPIMSGWLSVMIGTGVQLSVSACFLMIFACFGFLSPANRGALMQAMLFLFVFMGMVGGYTSARFFRMFKGNRWKSNSLWTAMLFPGFVFALFFVLNLMIWGQKSSGAVPFGTLFALLSMWLFISTPLVIVGSYFGFRKQPIEFPVRTNQIPRQVPIQPWFVNGPLNILVGGVLPFGAVFVEVFYVLSSIWLHQFYYLFGFLFLVLLILLMTCAEVTIVLCYFQLCSENYHWWWRAYFTAGCSSLYLFLYSMYYAYTKLQMARAVAGLLYVGYMLIVSVSFFLITGSFGFIACFIFVRHIYSSIKID